MITKKSQFWVYKIIKHTILVLRSKQKVFKLCQYKWNHVESYGITLNHIFCDSTYLKVNFL